MDSLSFLLNLKNLGDAIMIAKQSQLLKQKINNNQIQVPSILKPNVKMDSLNNEGLYSSTSSQVSNSSTNYIVDPNPYKSTFAQELPIDNLIYNLEKAAEEQKRNQKKILEEISNQHDFLIQTIDEFIQDKEELKSKVDELEKLVNDKLKSRQESPKEQKKKNRRCAQEINKEFRCPYENCSKSYGSDISMNLHIKLKHNGGSKTEREQLAKKVWEAKMSNQVLPDLDIAFPPGFLASFEEQMIKEQQFKSRKFSEISYTSTAEQSL
ncbi:zinc finger, C2H2 type family protein (macronuclear) [Tetrahymena thermophila SB210]|uniref:Zinc finger, C2H2 type family protein n=1 Tax=Tetrahymena thermophila (strain SB210) TaxID=312017 RepID=I7MKS9_TETTS|nr:zinc finger, C2H2 type family protein [Tetrahymena thermophila SB210]EAS00246.1 zinc finger, C2H2 type family protein [Tetrahymena thermophila SB210]|eukprot:XP_001020491.1 zinc finger, C2H2 type family protein [Tetrahymena thermophila SB210]